MNSPALVKITIYIECTTKINYNFTFINLQRICHLYTIYRI